MIEYRNRLTRIVDESNSITPTQTYRPADKLNFRFDYSAAQIQISCQNWVWCAPRWRLYLA